MNDFVFSFKSEISDEFSTMYATSHESHFGLAVNQENVR